MRWSSFIDFWIMRELGMEDAIFRNYDLLKFTGRDRKWELHLWLAMRRMGLEPANSKTAADMIPEVAQRIANVYSCPRPDYETLRIRIIAWAVWDRIRTGETQTWFKSEMRKG